MFRQSATKLMSPMAAMTRGSFVRNCSAKKQSEPLCAHHKELVPPFSEVCKLKTFELKSDCTTFHMTTCGYDPLTTKSKGPCPDDNPCAKKKWWRRDWSFPQEHERSKLSKPSPFTRDLNKNSFSPNVKSKTFAFVINLLISRSRDFPNSRN